MVKLCACWLCWFILTVSIMIYTCIIIIEWYKGALHYIFYATLHLRINNYVNFIIVLSDRKNRNRYEYMTQFSYQILFQKEIITWIVWQFVRTHNDNEFCERYFRETKHLKQNICQTPTDTHKYIFSSTDTKQVLAINNHNNNKIIKKIGKFNQ